MKLTEFVIRFKFVCAVWGDAFTNTFLNVCLPSMLSEGNLQFVAAHSHSSYHIYTLPSDVQSIDCSPAIRKLRTLMPVEVVRPETDLPDGDKDKPYALMVAAHADFIKKSNSDGSAMVFIPPDTIWGNGSFRRLLEIAQSGKRLVMLGSARLEKESFLLSLQPYMKGGVLPGISKRDLVRLAMNHLHTETESLVWNSGVLNTWPSILFWKVQREGLIVRAFHLHPLMVWPHIGGNFVPLAASIDGDYLANVCPDPADEYIVLDSDEIVAFELSTRHYRSDQISYQRLDPAFIARWANAVIKATDSRHRQFIQHRIRLHAKVFSRTWKAVEDDSDRVVGEIRILLEGR